MCYMVTLHIHIHHPLHLLLTSHSIIIKVPHHNSPLALNLNNIPHSSTSYSCMRLLTQRNYDPIMASAVESVERQIKILPLPQAPCSLF